MFEHRPFGTRLKLSVRGASHAPAIEFSLDHFPDGLTVDEKAFQAFMERRAPGRDNLSTQRHETDEVKFVSGLKENRTNGQRIVGRIENADRRPGDYGAERTIPRPGHADYGQWIEQGRIPTGGGANSGRLTVALCAAGALCKQWLARRGVAVDACIERIGGRDSDFESTIDAARRDGDSVGGTIVCEVKGLQPGLGGALFAGIESELSAALFAIPGVKGVEFGNGFAAAELKGSENNDAFVHDEGRLLTETNRHGGILGGRTTGMPLKFRVALKPTPTIFKPQPSVDLATMATADCEMKGRHDPCIVRRAVPVVEAVAAFVMTDLILATESSTPRICLTLTGKTLAEDWQQFVSQRLFVDMLELRIDLLDASERDHVRDWIAKSPVPVIVTFRKACDGGAFVGTDPKFLGTDPNSVGTDPNSVGNSAGTDPNSVGNSAGTDPNLVGTDPERETFFHSLLSKPLPTSSEVYVDFEDDFRVEELTFLAQMRGVRIIRSKHIFLGSVPNSAENSEGSVPTNLPTNLGSVPNVAEVCRAMVAGTNEIAKLAISVRNADDLIRFFSESATLTDVPHVVCAMGSVGRASRVLAVRTGSLWSYASVSGLSELGHLTPHEMVRDYRMRGQTPDCMWGQTPNFRGQTPSFRGQTPSFDLYGVTGWPLKKTRSPEIHNAAFAAADVDAVMASFPVETAGEVISLVRKMGLKGMAVTIPHKESIMPLLDEISSEAQEIGAVNTIVVRDGRLIGHNTDADGFSEALTRFLDCLRLDGKRVAVLGAGGASKAVVFALKRLGAEVEVFHRRTPSTEFSVIVNATPVDPIPDYKFTGREAVYDLVYVPDETPLMARARAAGCRVENGFSMLMAQARRQRELWGC